MVQLEKLVVSLEARINQYEKNLAKAQGTTQREFKRIEAASASLDGRLARIGRGAFGELAKGALMAAVPIVSFSAAIDGAKAAMAEFGDISDNAKASGLDVEFFQGLGHGAQMAGVDMGAFSGALATFNKNSGLAVENKGRMVAALKALNPELLANIQAARSQEERVRLAADAMRDADGAANRAALSTALFGDAGFKLADAFSGGSGGIDEMMRSARQLGVVVDRDLISRAEQLGDEFDTATKVLDLQFKQVLIDLVPFLTGTAQAVIGLVNAVQDLWGAISSSPGAQSFAASTAPLNERSLEIMQEQLASKRHVLTQDGLWDRPKVEREVADLEAAIAARSDPTKFDVGASFGKLTGPSFGSVDDMRAALTGFAPTTGGSGGGGVSSGRNDAAEAAIRQAETVRDLVSDLKFEQEQLGRTAEQQELYNALKSAGVTLESAYGQEIQGAMTALQAQRSAIEGNAEAMALFESVSQQALQTVIDGFREGKSAGEIFGNLLSDIGSQLLSMGISGLTSGLGAALFPGIPKREHGGPVRRGQPYIVGERRPELFVPDQNGTIVPRLPDASAAGGMGGAFTFAPVINAPNSDAAALARLQNSMVQMASEMDGKVKQIVRTQGRKWK